MAAAAAAVRAAIATKAAQQASAQQASAQVWIDASEPEAPAAYPVAATSDPLDAGSAGPWGLLHSPLARGAAGANCVGAVRGRRFAPGNDRSAGR